jgi:hypothetical protein
LRGGASAASMKAGMFMGIVSGSKANGPTCAASIA